MIFKLFSGKLSTTQIYLGSIHVIMFKNTVTNNFGYGLYDQKFMSWCHKKLNIPDYATCEKSLLNSLKDIYGHI